MVHCHLEPHIANGMMILLAYEGVVPSCPAAAFYNPLTAAIADDQAMAPEMVMPVTDAARQKAERLRGEVGAAVQEGRMEEAVPFTGQSVGPLREVLPAAEIVRRLVAEADPALRRGAAPAT
jgi:NAD(P)H-dependent flavin oxidoreductase YrpB (nitropropane dioxygenase family)